MVFEWAWEYFIIIIIIIIIMFYYEMEGTEEVKLIKHYHQ